MKVRHVVQATLLIWAILFCAADDQNRTDAVRWAPVPNASEQESSSTENRQEVDDDPRALELAAPAAAAGESDRPPDSADFLVGRYASEITGSMPSDSDAVGGQVRAAATAAAANRTGKRILIMDCLLDGSHTHIQRLMARELASRGHAVTWLTITDLLYWPTEQDRERITFRVFDSSVKLEHAQQHFDLWTRMALKGELSSFTWYAKMWLGWTGDEFKSLFTNVNIVLKDQLDNTDWDELRAAEFDLVLCEVMTPICSVVAHDILRVPFVNTINGGPLGTRYSRWYNQPSPVSYVPEFVTWYKDAMTFPQRVKNLLTHALSLLIYDYVLFISVDRERDRLGLDTTIGTRELMSRAELYLYNWDFTLEFPRPVTPNTIMIGGLTISKPEPLPQVMEEFIQGSGQHGLVVFSVSTLLRVMDQDMANMIGAALARLPQRVIWKYLGKEKPATLGNNTMTSPWIPQQNLLAHEKTRLLIYHGGLNGGYEAMYYGVPILGIPLFTDQADDLVRLKYRLGMAEFFAKGMRGLTSEKLYDGIQEVLGNSSYRENAKRVSRQMRDVEATEQGTLPLTRTARWVEYAMEHGGEHLRPRGGSLAWYQYFLLDVLAVYAVVASACVWSVKRCWHRLCGAWN